MKILSVDEAYAAMFAFLERQFQISGSDELGSMLGSMSLLPDGSTADPAMRQEWLAAVEQAVLGNVRLHLQLKI